MIPEESAPPKRNRRGDMLTGASFIVVIVIMGIVVFSPLDEYAKGVITTILGVFLNVITNVVSFEFGTTRKTEEKQTQITNEYLKS
jgi:uncharacterized protein YacL